MTKKGPTIDPGQGNTPLPLPQAPVSHLWSPGLVRNARRGRMSIVEGTQQRMFAFPAGQAAPQGQHSEGSEWSGQGDTERGGLQLKRGKSASPSFELQPPGRRGALAGFLKRSKAGGFR